MINITDSAKEKIEDMLNKKGKVGLRVGVVGGGCSGLQYRMGAEDELQEGDVELVENGVRLFVDKRSLTYLAGATIEYTDGWYGSGINIINPNASSTCGCGKSFS
ncbi:MAG: iron-sulfur cluster assembly accessory protein [Nanoarchaeota archaeon]